jgi:hypothetical protein
MTSLEMSNSVQESRMVSVRSPEKESDHLHAVSEAGGPAPSSTAGMTTGATRTDATLKASSCIGSLLKGSIRLWDRLSSRSSGGGERRSTGWSACPTQFFNGLSGGGAGTKRAWMHSRNTPQPQPKATAEGLVAERPVCLPPTGLSGERRLEDREFVVFLLDLGEFQFLKEHRWGDDG